MLHYKIYKNQAKNNVSTYGKYYGRAVVNETIGLDGLAEHMSKHNTPFSKGAIQGVLTDMVDCIHEMVLNGIAVKIPNLAIFSVGIKTVGSEKAEDFNSSKNVSSFKLRARATGDFTRAELEHVVKIAEQDEYASGKGSISGNQGTPATGEGGSTAGGDSQQGGEVEM